MVSDKEENKVKESGSTRRDFLRKSAVGIAGIGVVSILSGYGPKGSGVKEHPAYRVKDIWRVEPVNEGQCVNCQNCQLACSSCHEGDGLPALEYSRIRVENTLGDWYSGKNVDRVSRHICRQCPGIPPCAAVCPENTYYRDKVTGAVLIDDEKCVRCQTCIEACPYNAIWYSEELDKVLKCDLDQGKMHPKPPECVQNCAMGLLKYVKIA